MSSLFTTITNTSTASELVAAILSAAGNVSVEKILSGITNMGDANVRKCLFFTSITACMTIKASGNEMHRRLNAICPDTFIVDRNINMSACALLGHLIFDAMVTYPSALVAPMLGMYRAKCGNVTTLRDFSVTSSVEGKEKRTELLRKWADMIKAADEDTTRNAIMIAFGEFFDEDEEA
jgi:hypothetical protein